MTAPVHGTNPLVEEKGRAGGRRPPSRNANVVSWLRGDAGQPAARAEKGFFAMFVERILATQVGLPIVPPRTTPPTTSVSPLRIGGSQGLLWMWVETAGVLYEDTCWWRWLAQVLARMGFTTRHDRLRETWTWHWESAQADARNGEDFWYVLAICLEQMGLSKGCTQEVLAAAVARQKQLDHQGLAYRGVSNTLAQLVRAGVQLAALSDAEC